MYDGIQIFSQPGSTRPATARNAGAVLFRQYSNGAIDKYYGNCPAALMGFCEGWQISR